MASSVNNEPTFWKRVGYVAIEDRQGRMIRYGNGENETLDFRFDGTITNEICPKFTVGVLGFNLKTIQDLTVWNPAEAVARSRRIQVFAGYGKDGLANPIFDGRIFEALPTNPPEMWMNFTCLINGNKLNPENGIVLENYTIFEIWRFLADKLGMKAQWNAKRMRPDHVVKRFYVSGLPGRLLEDLCKRYDLIHSAEHGMLIANDAYGWRTIPENDALSKQSRNSSSPVFLVSQETGMLGLSNISLAGAKVRMRLTDLPKFRSWVMVKSKIIPSANGYYYVIKKRHVGHFRGNEWYTELDLIRKTNGNG